MSMKARTSLPGSSGARRARSASSSRLTFSSWSTFPQVNDRRTIPAWTEPGSRRTAPASPRTAAGPCHRCCPPWRSSRQPGTEPSDARSHRTGRQSGHVLRSANGSFSNSHCPSSEGTFLSLPKTSSVQLMPHIGTHEALHRVGCVVVCQAGDWSGATSGTGSGWSGRAFAMP